MRAHALQLRLADLADDVGRLRRRADADTSLALLADRLADHVSWLHLLTTPTAAELAAWTFPEDEETVDAAIEAVNETWERLQRRLGIAVEPDTYERAAARQVLQLGQAGRRRNP